MPPMGLRLITASDPGSMVMVHPGGTQRLLVLFHVTRLLFLPSRPPCSFESVFAGFQVPLTAGLESHVGRFTKGPPLTFVPRAHPGHHGGVEYAGDLACPAVGQFLRLISRQVEVISGSLAGTCGCMECESQAYRCHRLGIFPELWAWQATVKL